MASFFDRLIARNQRRYYLAIDVGSNTAIRSLAIEADPDGLDPRMRAKLYRELPGRDETHTTITVIQSELRRIIFEHVRGLKKVPDETLIGLGSHFTFNAIEKINLKREVSSRQITLEEIKAFLTDQLGSREVDGLENKDYHLAVATPFVIEADGYRIEKIGQATGAKTLTFTLLNTYASHRYWESLQNLRSMFGGLKIGFVSNQAAVASLIVDILGVEEALIVKIGAKITEVAHLKSWAILSSGQFSFGGDDFTRALAQELSISFAQAEKIKKETGQLIHNPAMAARVNLTLQKASDQWLERLVKFLDIQPNLVLPETIFILGGGARLEAIRNILTSSQWHSIFTFLPRLNVVRLEGQDMSRMIFPKSSPPLDGPEEVALAGLSYRLLHKPEKVEVIVHGPPTNF